MRVGCASIHYVVYGKLEWFAWKELLYRMHECVFGVLAQGYNFGKNSPTENRSILEQMVDLIVELKMPALMFVVRKCNLKNYCQSKFGMGIKIDPYLIAFPYISLSFDYYIKTKSSNGMIFLEERSALVNRIEDMLERLRLIEPADSKIRIDRIIEKALFLESSKSNVPQTGGVIRQIG